MKSFNTIGFCSPEQHYMADVGDKVRRLVRMADGGKYCSLLGPRQSGKTSMLFQLRWELLDRYYVLYASFRIPKASFGSSQAFVQALVSELDARMEAGGVPQTLLQEWNSMPLEGETWDRSPFDCLTQRLRKLCAKADRGVVLLLDGPDECPNLVILNKLLAVLRDEYQRAQELGEPALRSVILAGVRDVRSLKEIDRYGEETERASPWTIASKLSLDLNLSEKAIAGMLADYEADSQTGMDVQAMAALLQEYTAGQPFLVSRFCQAMDEKAEEEGDPEQVWSREGFLETVRQMLDESNPFFDGLLALLKQENGLKNRIWRHLMNGEVQEFNRYNQEVSLGVDAGLLINRNGMVAVSSRYLEMYLTHWCLSQERLDDSLLEAARGLRKTSIRAGKLDLEQVLQDYRMEYSVRYGFNKGGYESTIRMRTFQTFLSVLLSNWGIFYVDPDTRENGRMDIWIEIPGQRYIVEVCVWGRNRGEDDKEIVMRDYLDRYNLQEGYMLGYNEEFVMSFMEKNPKRHDIDGRTVIKAEV